METSQSSSPDSPCVVYQRPSSSTPRASILTYEAAYKACQIHMEKLQRKIQDRYGNNNQEVVVAFLAQNSADFFLATLACTEIDNALPVLLNTRWTPLEMAQALKSQNSQDATILVHDQANANRMEQVAAILRENHPKDFYLILTVVVSINIPKTSFDVPNFLISELVLLNNAVYSFHSILF